MNSVHDIGGMDGFGPVREEANEPVFHEPWEARVFGMTLLRAGVPNPPTLDAGRHRLECLPPAQYLSSTYYERWLAGQEALLLEAGTLTREAVDAKVAQFAADPTLPMPRREDPAFAAEIRRIVRDGRPVTRAIKAKPRFAVGDRVVTRNLHPHGHTRMPRYTRNKRAVIVAHHGAHVFPDTNAHGLGENPQHLYTVRISARELWGDSAEPNECVLIDLWESYLAPDGAATKPSPAQHASSLKAPKAMPGKAKIVKAKRATVKVAARTRIPVRGKAKTTRKNT